jgi:hypothetical protein
MKALASLKEVASGRRGRSSTGREATIERSSTKDVDEQIAQLLDTVEGDARPPHLPAGDHVAHGPSPAPAGSRKQPRLSGTSGPTLAERLLRLFRRGWNDVSSAVTYILLGTTLGILIGGLLGR